MRRPKSKKFKLQKRQAEFEEIELLESWIESDRPESGSNPLSLQPLPRKAPVGRLPDGFFSPYAASTKFSQLPLSKKTKDALAGAKYKDMTDIQRASLPHSLCGRDILGAAKTGSGKTLAFVIPVLEKLYRARWGPEDGIGCIILSPTRELAGQIFDVLKSVGKYHNFSAGLLIGGRKEVDVEKEHVNNLNMLVCTPGRLLQHMDETENFDCSHLQVLVLDEADRVLDEKFKRDVNAIISQLPKHRQTLLYSATQTKSVQDLARLSLKDPEYLSVHEESATATPDHLVQKVMMVPLEHKLDMLWSFIKVNLNSQILVFLSTCKQVKFAFEMFKKLRPGIPLRCIHGNMKLEKRIGIYSQFCDEKRSVLFATDVASRGLDFNKSVDWVVQVDCPENVAAYIHRVGRTARFMSSGRSLLFLTPSEMNMLEKLQDKKIPIKPTKVNKKRLQPISGLLAALLVKYPNLQYLAQRAFIMYLKSVHIQKDKEVFDVIKLPIDEFAASLGLPMTPKIRFLKKMKGKISEELSLSQASSANESLLENSASTFDTSKFIGEEVENEVGKEILLRKETFNSEKETEIGDPGTRVLKKKKLKINLHRPVGTRVVFDEEGNTLPPLAKLAEIKSTPELVQLDKEKVQQRYAELRKELKQVDEEDKALDRKRRKEKRIKDKAKWKKERTEDESDMGNEDGLSVSDKEESEGRVNKKAKIYFDTDSDDGESPREEDNKDIGSASMSLEEQEKLALKLLSSMH